ncbi:MAG: radical SAM protein [Candidatus Nanoarchaeia archaeon]|nr:radical SAM protein [Candidatus Nanoarchaeia archaeon]
MENLKELLEESNKIHLENHGNKVWFGRCIFLSWYCKLGTCKFCFRSTQKSRIHDEKTARRSLSSVLVETLLSKKLNWKIEFLTGGYGIFSVKELIDIMKKVSEVYGEKIWINLGAVEKQDLELFKPYLKGIVASIETVNPELHNKICPDKAIQPYEKMFSYSKDLKKSMTIVIGLGEKKEDFENLAEFIEKNKLERITFYALKPVKGTPYTKGPTTEDYVWWIAKTRIRFPKLQIITGTTYNRVAEIEKYNTKDEIYLLMKAGANAITKFPATKKFNTEAAKKIEAQIKKADRVFTSTLTKIPKVNWDKEIDSLSLDEKLKEQMKIQIKEYLHRMGKE